MKTSILFSKNDIQQKVATMAEQINQHYQSKDILAIGILKGAFVFYSDLVKLLEPSLICDFCMVSYYGDSSKAKSEAQITMDVKESIKDKHVLLIDCIADCGHTLNFMKSHLQQRQAKSIKTAVLLSKPQALKRADIDFSGFQIEQDNFVIGYGIDYKNHGRNLDHFAVVEDIN